MADTTSKDSETGHCWHATGSGTTYWTGGAYAVQCCHCGTHANMRWVEAHRPIKGHGPHVSQRVQVDQGTDCTTPCPATKGPVDAR